MTVMNAEPEIAGAVPLEETGRQAEFIAAGDRARDVREWPRARAAYEEALRLNPNLAPIWIQLGHAAKESGDVQAAEAAYRKALEINPADADGHLQLGHLLKVGGRLEAALEFYTQAVALDPQFMDAHAEIESLRQRLTAARGIRGPAMAVYPTVRTRKRSGSSSLAVIFEVSDLLVYFQSSRLPTGIQRVQMEVIKGIIEIHPADLDYSIVCFAQDRGIWVEIPAALFSNLCYFSVSGGDSAAPEWRSLLSTLETVFEGGRPFRFPEGGLLVDLGTSWWQRNYFLNVRMAKAGCSIRYVPFIHDLIPVMTPEYCDANLRRDFLSWIVGVLQHANYFFVNSQATRNDLATVATELGHTLGDVAVVPLNADFRLTTEEVEEAENPDAILQSYDLASERYVLCVATIEARKNHAAAFAVWLRLIKKYGTAKVPKLVCVGKDGWLNDGIYNMLAASEILSTHVIMLQNISDIALATLYKNCLCTIYPTFYEGWGLPVTEALSYGKVPLTANVSSLPEAGGDFSEYFDIGSENDLLAKLERLVFDEKYRAAREKKIAKEFRPRTWLQITEQIVGQLKEWAAAHADAPSDRDQLSVGTAELGVLHSLARRRDTILWRGMHDAEIYRSGPAWWAMEDWGCWTKPGGPARISFRLSEASDSPTLIYVGLRGLSGVETVCTVKCEGARPVQIELRPGEDKVAVMELQQNTDPDQTVVVSIASSSLADLASLTEGRDTRVIGPGVRWFYVCHRDDVLARVAMAEAIATNDFRRLMRQPPVKPEFFLHT